METFRFFFGQADVRKWLLTGLLLRFVVMPFTTHPDLYFSHKTPHLLLHGILDAYGQTTTNSYYPPLTLLFYGAIQWFFSFFIPGFESFLHDIYNSRAEEILNGENLFFYLFLLKTPFLIIEWFLVVTCWKLIPEKKSTKNFVRIWAINPIMIYGTYMTGKFDLIPAFCVTLACYYSLKNGREHLGFLLLGVGFLFKVFPIIFFPLLIFISCRSGKNLFRFSLYCFAPIIVFYGGFYLISGVKVFGIFMNIFYFTEVYTDISSNMGTLIIRFFQIAVYFMVCAHLWFYRKNSLDYSLLVQYFLLIYFAFFWTILISSTHQFIWVMPFMMFYVNSKKKWEKVFYLVIAIIFLGGLESREAFFGLFAPLNPKLFMSLPSLQDFTGYIFDQDLYKQTIESFYFGVTAIWSFSIFKNLFYPFRKPFSIN